MCVKDGCVNFNVMFRTLICKQCSGNSIKSMTCDLILALSLSYMYWSSDQHLYYFI